MVIAIVLSAINNAKLYIAIFVLYVEYSAQMEAMVELKRRDFLKGLLGLAGVAAVGLPPVADDTLFAEIDTFLDAGGEPPLRPEGPIGSVRFGDRWFALHDYSIDMYRDAVDITDPASDAWRIYKPGPISWTLHLGVTDFQGVHMPHDAQGFEIASAGRTFSGHVFLDSVHQILEADNTILTMLKLHGIGLLHYEAA